MRHPSQTSFTNHPSPPIFATCGKIVFSSSYSARRFCIREMEVDERMLGELEGMGFSKTLAAKALSSSGNSSIEDAVNWLVDHEDDAAAINETPMEPEVLGNINIEVSLPIQISELVKLRAQDLRDQAFKRKGEGKELLEAKRMMEESERKRFLVHQKADKEEERTAQERIHQKLQQDKNPPQPVDYAVSPETQPASARECMRECLRSLKRQNKEDNTQATRAFQTLLIYVKNVFQDPDEVKLRKIRLSNPIFQERVGKFEEGVKFLELCGFERVEGGNFLFLVRERVDRSMLKSAATELHNALTNPYFGLFSA